MNFSRDEISIPRNTGSGRKKGRKKEDSPPGVARLRRPVNDLVNIKIC